MHRGYLKLWRKIRDNPRMRDPHYLAVWITLLTEAAYKDRDVVFGGKRITLKPGQLITGRRQIAENTGVQESKVERILTLLKNEQQIEQRTSSINRLITITNWHIYQDGEQRIEQQVNNDRTTSEQRVNTPEELKNYKNDKNVRKERRFTPPSVDEVASYCRLERNNNINANTFVDFYSAKGWKVGNQPMKDWRAAVRTWEKRHRNDSHGSGKISEEWIQKWIKEEDCA